MSLRRIGPQQESFILSGGKWYMVDKKFAERITADYNDIKDYDGKFPDYKHADEGDYLKAVTSCIPMGRRSIASERLLRALLLQVFYTVRSERLLMEELNYNLLFRWLWD
jgi:hypothetical protein